MAAWAWVAAGGSAHAEAAFVYVALATRANSTWLAHIAAAAWFKGSSLLGSAHMLGVCGLCISSKSDGRTLLRVSTVCRLAPRLFVETGTDMIH